MLSKESEEFLTSLPEHERIDLIEQAAIIWGYAGHEPALRDPLTDVVIKRYKREKESERNAAK